MLGPSIKEWTHDCRLKASLDPVSIENSCPFARPFCVRERKTVERKTVLTCPERHGAIGSDIIRSRASITRSVINSVHMMHTHDTHTLEKLRIEFHPTLLRVLELSFAAWRSVPDRPAILVGANNLGASKTLRVKGLPQLLDVTTVPRCFIPHAHVRYVETVHVASSSVEIKVIIQSCLAVVPALLSLSDPGRRAPSQGGYGDVRVAFDGFFRQPPLITSVVTQRIRIIGVVHMARFRAPRTLTVTCRTHVLYPGGRFSPINK